MRHALLIASLAVLAGCAPKLEFGRNGPPSEILARSTHLFLGVIEDQVFPFYPFYRLPIDDSGHWRILRRRVRVEAVLKGSESRPYVYIYEIFWTGGGTGDWNSTQIAGRYLFPVRVENGSYHVTGDYWRSIFRVQSGLHSRLPLDDSHDIDERVALLQFWPATDHDRYFPHLTIVHPSVSRWRQAKLLRGLLRHAEASIRTQACVLLVRFRSGQDERLPSIPLSALNAGNQQTAESQIARNRQFEREARTRWSQLLPYVKAPGVLSSLRLFTTIRDPTLRAHFCREFTRLFPNDPDHGCPADRPPPATIVTAEGDVPLAGPWPAP